MNKAATFETIRNNIDTDIHTCDELLQLLDSERQALKDRAPEVLESIINSKTIKLKHLEASAHQRSLWLPENTENQAQEQLWLDLLKKTNPHLQALWESLKQRLQNCQSQNEINGKLLSRNQQVFKRILTIMRGQISESQDLYTQEGSKSNRSGYQTLGKA